LAFHRLQRSTREDRIKLLKDYQVYYWWHSDIWWRRYRRRGYRRPWCQMSRFNGTLQRTKSEAK
jgi:hypothetical protein